MAEDSIDYSALTSYGSDETPSGIGNVKVYDGKGYYVTVRLSDIRGSRFEECENPDTGEPERGLFIPFKHSGVTVTPKKNVQYAINMKRELVSKEVAVTLKEMGHDEYCDCYYHTDNDIPWDYEMGRYQQRNSTLLGERVAAPYVTDAVLWLMQHRGIAQSVDMEPSGDSETGFVYDVSLYSKGVKVKVVNIDYQVALVKAVDLLLEDDNFTLSSDPSYKMI